MLSCPFTNECATQAINDMLKNSTNPPKRFDLFRPLDISMKFQILLYLFPKLAQDCGLLSTLKNMISFPEQDGYKYALLGRDDIYEPTKNTPLVLFDKMIHRYTMTDRKLLGDFAPMLYVWLRDTELKNMLADFWLNQLDEVANMRHIEKYIGNFGSVIYFVGTSEKDILSHNIIILFGDIKKTSSYCYNSCSEGNGVYYSDEYPLLASYLSHTYGQTGRCQNIFLRMIKRYEKPEEREHIMWKYLPDVLAHSLPIELRKIVGEYLDYPRQAKR